MAHFVELERECIRSWGDLEMTIPDAIEWLKGHLAKVPPALHDRTVFRASMEHGYYEGDVDCFIEIGFFTKDDPGHWKRGTDVVAYRLDTALSE